MCGSDAVAVIIIVVVHEYGVGVQTTKVWVQLSGQDASRVDRLRSPVTRTLSQLSLSHRSLMFHQVDFPYAQRPVCQSICLQERVVVHRKSQDVAAHTTAYMYLFMYSMNRMYASISP